MSLFTQFAKNPLLIAAMIAVVWSFYLPKTESAAMCGVALAAMFLNILYQLLCELREIKRLLKDGQQKNV